LGLLLLFSAAFVAALPGALMPGPVLFATVRWSAQHGRRVGPCIVAGHAAVEAPLMAALVLGLGGVLSRNAFVGAVGLAGGAVLLAMGALMLKAMPRLSLPGGGKAPGRAAEAEPFSAVRIIAAGAFTSVSNPYFALWWATVGLRLLAFAKPFGLSGYAVFYAGHVLADLAWYGAVAEMLHHGRRLLSDRGYRVLVGVCAVLLIGIGVYFAWRGWGMLGG
jgi:threonine/homoserine/homoserine lactone efflux protein